MTESILLESIVQGGTLKLNPDSPAEGIGEVVFHEGLKYEGTFASGRLHGRGKLSWAHEAMEYDGDITGNNISGQGRFTWGNGCAYEGEVLNGLRHGYGTCACGPLRYQGMWKESKKHGEGVLYYNEMKSSYYAGNWVSDSKCGWGVMQFASGNTYEGEWLDDVPHGKGTMRWRGGSGGVAEIYVGDWQFGVPDGIGEYTWFVDKDESSAPYPLENRYAGSWKEGSRDGQGIYVYADGSKYEGGWMKNLKHGKGVYTTADGSTYEGEWANDKFASDERFSLEKASKEFQIKLFVDDLLLFEEDPQGELKHTSTLVLRHISDLKKIYTFYSALPSLAAANTSSPNTADPATAAAPATGAFQHRPGTPSTAAMHGQGFTPSDVTAATTEQQLINDATSTATERGDGETPQTGNFTMNLFQFWAFLSDAGLHTPSNPFSKVDRTLFKALRKGDASMYNDIHYPDIRFLFRDFTEGIVRLAANLALPPPPPTAEPSTKRSAYDVQSTTSVDHANSLSHKVSKLIKGWIVNNQFKGNLREHDRFFIEFCSPEVQVLLRKHHEKLGSLFLSCNKTRPQASVLPDQTVRIKDFIRLLSEHGIVEPAKPDPPPITSPTAGSRMQSPKSARPLSTRLKSPRAGDKMAQVVGAVMAQPAPAGPPAPGSNLTILQALEIVMLAYKTYEPEPDLTEISSETDASRPGTANFRPTSSGSRYSVAPSDLASISQRGPRGATLVPPAEDAQLTASMSKRSLLSSRSHATFASEPPVVVSANGSGGNTRPSTARTGVAPQVPPLGMDQTEQEKKERLRQEMSVNICNMELEMIYFEFLEAFARIANHKMADKQDLRSRVEAFLAKYFM